MSDHEYTVDLSTPEFQIEISPSTQYGFFEHHELGDECGGGLWFEGKELVDYDGVFQLPADVATALRNANYILNDSFD